MFLHADPSLNTNSSSSPPGSHQPTRIKKFIANDVAHFYIHKCVLCYVNKSVCCINCSSDRRSERVMTHDLPLYFALTISVRAQG